MANSWRQFHNEATKRLYQHPQFPTFKSLTGFLRTLAETPISAFGLHLPSLVQTLAIPPRLVRKLVEDPQAAQNLIRALPHLTSLHDIDIEVQHYDSFGSPTAPSSHDFEAACLSAFHSSLTGATVTGELEEAVGLSPLAPFRLGPAKQVCFSLKTCRQDDSYSAL